MQKSGSDPKTALVTGAASGIGRATAILLSQSGYRVAVLDLPGSDLKSTLDQMNSGSLRHLELYADVSSEADLLTAFGSIENEFSTLNVAVNNAGIDPGVKRFLDCSAAEFDHVVAVNLKGTFLCLQKELALMSKQRSGAIVNISSVLGVVGSPGSSVYSATKHGVMGLTKSLGAEFAKKGIRINAVCPGGVDTPMIERTRTANPALIENVIKQHPVGRLADPIEIARAVVWLCSDDASFVVGTGLCIDGGLTCV